MIRNMFCKINDIIDQKNKKDMQYRFTNDRLTKQFTKCRMKRLSLMDNRFVTTSFGIVAVQIVH